MKTETKIKKTEDYFSKFPTLSSVLMVEKTIEEYSGEFNVKELWKKLPEKISWKTYLIILDYLENKNRIAFDKENKIAYIWNPKLTKRIKKREEIKL